MVFIFSSVLFSRLKYGNWVKQFSMPEFCKALECFPTVRRYEGCPKDIFFRELLRFGNPNSIENSLIALFNPYVPIAPFLYPWKHQKTVLFCLLYFCNDLWSLSLLQTWFHLPTFLFVLVTPLYIDVLAYFHLQIRS